METSTPLVTTSPAPVIPTTAEAAAPQPALVAQAEQPRLSPPQSPEQTSCHAKSARHAQREKSRRYEQRRQRFASYRDSIGKAGHSQLVSHR